MRVKIRWRSPSQTGMEYSCTTDVKTGALEASPSTTLKFTTCPIVSYCDTPLVNSVLYLCKTKREYKTEKKENRHLKERGKKWKSKKKEKKKSERKRSPTCIYAVYSICLLL